MIIISENSKSTDLSLLLEKKIKEEMEFTEFSKEEAIIKIYSDNMLSEKSLNYVEYLFNESVEKNVYYSVIKKLVDEFSEIDKYLVVNTKTLKTQSISQVSDTDCEELCDIYDYDYFDNCVDFAYTDDDVPSELECRYCKLYRLRELIKENKNIKLIKK